MTNSRVLKLNHNNLDANVNFIWHSRSDSQKRAFRKYLFEVNELRGIIQDQDQEVRIHKLYNLLVLVDIYCLQIMLDMKSLKRFPVYIYLIARSLRSLCHLNQKMKKSIESLGHSKTRRNLNHRELLQHQISIDLIGLDKIEHLQLIEDYLSLAESSVFQILERLNEEHAY